MAKNRALRKNGTVGKLLWCSDMELETDTLIDCGELPVSLGDSDSGGKICRDGQEALSEAEARGPGTRNCRTPWPRWWKRSAT